MASEDLYGSLSPLFWFLRLTGATPFLHVRSLAGILTFRWCHPQTFWFAFVTLVHLSFIVAQLFWGCFALAAQVDQQGDSSPDQLTSNSSIRYTNYIAQMRFLVDSFLLSKLIHLNLSSFQAFFERLGNTDHWIRGPILLSSRVRKPIIAGTVIVFILQFVDWLAALLKILERQESSWMIFARIMDTTMHVTGQLHSNMFVIQYASLCYVVGLRFQCLTELMLQNVVTDPSLLYWMSRPLSDVSRSSRDDTNIVRRLSDGNQVLPDNDGSLTRADPQKTTFYRPLSTTLVVLKTIYISLSETVVVYLNHIFGLSLLLFLISKLINASIGCHSFIVQLLKTGFFSFYWFTTHVPDIVCIFVMFQSADYVRAKVKGFLNSVDKISTEGLDSKERSEVQTFILQVRGETVELSVCGLFKLGKQLLPSVAGTIATYILVLLQFNA